MLLMDKKKKTAKQRSKKKKDKPKQTWLCKNSAKRSKKVKGNIKLLMK